MALSPLVHSSITSTGTTTLKPNSFTISPKSTEDGGSSMSHESDEEDAGELAEQMNSRNRKKFVKGPKLGEGTYAVVYKGHVRTNPSKKIAIKKIKVIADYKDGMTMDAIREVKALQELSHPNIIALLAVFSTKDQNLNLVLEYLPLGDLEVMIKDIKNISYTMPDIKAWMGMLCRAVWFCHENFVLHRDIKPNNLLIAADGEMKLADFGLARSFADPYTPMTWNVVTRWYRPPELFYKARYYSGAVDVWSVGCVFAELVLRIPFMAGNTDIHQLDLICQAIGSPTEENWPGVSSLEAFVPLEENKGTPLRTRKDFQMQFPQLSAAGIDLLMRMLTLDPNKRATTREVLRHEWWTQQPKPSKKEDLPRKGGGESRVAEDLKRRGGELEDENGRLDKIARKLDFGSSAR